MRVEIRCATVALRQITLSMSYLHFHRVATLRVEKSRISLPVLEFPRVTLEEIGILNVIKNWNERLLNE